MTRWREQKDAQPVYGMKRKAKDIKKVVEEPKDRPAITFAPKKVPEVDVKGAGKKAVAKKKKKGSTD